MAGLESVAFRNADDGGKILLVVNGAPEARTFDVRHAGRRLRYSLPAGGGGRLYLALMAGPDTWP